MVGGIVATGVAAPVGAPTCATSSVRSTSRRSSGLGGDGGHAKRGAPDRPVAGDGMARPIDRRDVLRLVADGAQLVEVLPRDEYDDEHLPAALHLPLKSLTAETAAVLDQARPVIVYCWDSL